MSYTIKELIGIDHKRIQLHIWPPEDVPVRGVLQIIHGMSEHLGRYALFAKRMNQQGWIVLGHDQRGHGKTAEQDQCWGYFDENQGLSLLLSDIYEVSQYVKTYYKDHTHVILGHSMGSFLLRCYLQLLDPELSGVILMGSGAAQLGSRSLTGLLAKGNTYFARNPAPRLQKIANQYFLRKIPYPKTYADWLSPNTKNVCSFLNDPLCGFPFTYNGYYVLFEAIILATQKQWATQIQAQIPIYIISGLEDPVGNYGQGPLQMATECKQAGKSVWLSLYPRLRHELIQGDPESVVCDDICDWLDKVQAF